MNKLRTTTAICMLSAIGMYANVPKLHPSDANYDDVICVDAPNCAVLAENVSTNNATNHEFVDLGLSVKWATCNIGANAPEEHGDYFAWGEIEPKEDYEWWAYKWCKGRENNLTKYCNDPSYGTVDNKQVLDLEDDVAHALWGDNWRMPTKSEFEELYTKCNWTWITVNGVKGLKVTGENGNSIFLPTTGFYYSDNQFDATSYGCYWSSTLNTKLTVGASSLYFNSGMVYLFNVSHCNGQPVRAVCP